LSMMEIDGKSDQLVMHLVQIFDLVSSRRENVKKRLKENK
jgi:hypothetical protein